MKNILLLLFSVFVLSGCSKDDEVKNNGVVVNSKKVLLKKATRINDSDKIKRELIYEYSGNKFMKIIYESDNYMQYVYTVNLITSIEGFYKGGINSSQLKYDSENRLTESIKTFYNGNKEYIKFAYSDGKIEFKEYSNSSFSDEFIVGTGIYYLDSKGNINKREYFKDGKLQKTIEYLFDDKNNYLNNVAGMNSVIAGLGSVINNTTSVKEYNSKGEKVSETGEIFKYNSEGYPISSIILNNGVRVGETTYEYF